MPRSLHARILLASALLLTNYLYVFPTAAGEDVPVGLSSPLILVDASQSLGPASDVGKFLGIQGPPSTFDRTNPNPWGIEAWRNINLSVADIPLFDDRDAPASSLAQTPVGIHARRTAQKTIDLDFSDFDSQIHFLRETLGQKSFDFAVYSMPKALSAVPDEPNGEYSRYAPKDYSEWYGLVYWSVLHIKEALGIAGAGYKVWTEPETYYNWRGKPGRKPGDRALLDDYIDLYVWTYRAIKSADPDARVGGPMTVSASSSINQALGLTWGMDDFLQALSKSLQKEETRGIALDEVIWQDYNWDSNEILADGAQHVQDLLNRYGFSSTTRQVVVGWNTNDNDVYYRGKTRSAENAASFIASNILREVSPTGNRLIDRAYLWPFDYDWGNPGLGLVTIPYPATSYAGQGGYAEPFHNAAVTRYSKRPAYAVLQMLQAMRWGRFIRATPDVRLNWEVLATRNGNSSVMVILVNHGEKQQSASLVVRNIPFSAKHMLARVQRIDKNHSADGNGLESGSQEVRSAEGNSLTLTVQMPDFSVALITLEPTA